MCISTETSFDPTPVSLDAFVIINLTYDTVKNGEVMQMPHLAVLAAVLTRLLNAMKGMITPK